MPENEPLVETALRAANQALTGSRTRDSRRLTALDLRIDDPRTGAWELAAMASVIVASTLVVVGLWLW